MRQVNSTRGVTGYKVPVHIKHQQEKLISMVLKVAQEGYVLPGNKVMIFTAEGEGTPSEMVNFKILEIEEV